MQNDWKVTLSREELGDLSICAIRYCMGRQTYMPSCIQSIVLDHVRDLSDKDIYVLIEDCERQAEMGLWGSETIDKPGWIRFKEKLEKEKERRSRD